MWVVEVIPQVRLGEAVALCQFGAAREVVVGVHVAGQGLEARNGERDRQTDEEKERILEETRAMTAAQRRRHAEEKIRKSRFASFLE